MVWLSQNPLTLNPLMHLMCLSLPTRLQLSLMRPTAVLPAHGQHLTAADQQALQMRAPLPCLSRARAQAAIAPGD